MSISVLVLLGLAVVVLLWLIRWGYRLRVVELDKAWLPMELRHARLVYTERVFRARTPVPIVARLDRGYRTAGGVIILVELKTRRLGRPYRSDVIELSAQRFAVQAQTGERVADYGYVVLQQAGRQRKTVYRVELLSDEQVVALVRRREAILLGDALSGYAASERLCTRCAFKSECDSARQ
jgi:CRISPR-associated exonuclease Cas4